MGRCGDRCKGRCRGVSLSSRPQRGSTEKEPEQPERTKNKERTRKEKPVLFGRYAVYAVPSRRYPVSAVPFRWYPVLTVPFGRYPVLAVPFWAVSRVGGTLLAVSYVGGTFVAEALKPKYGGIFSAVNKCFGGRRFFVFWR